MAQEIICNGIYMDTSSKGKLGHNHHKFRAEVRVDGKRLRKRFDSYDEARAWMDEWRKIRKSQQEHPNEPDKQTQTQKPR